MTTRAHPLVIVISLCLALLASPAEAVTRHVDGNTGSDGGNSCAAPATPCKTVAHAIASSANGDVIDIADAVYTEVLTLPVSLVLQGESRSGTIIQAAAQPGQASARVMTVSNDTDLAVRKLTLRHGVTSGSGGAIRIEGGDLTLENVDLLDNRVQEAGGGVFAQDSAATLSDVRFAGNRADQGAGVRSGGALYLRNGSLALEHGIFTGNVAGDSGGAIWMRDMTSASLSDVEITGNVAQGRGGGLLIRSSSPELTRVVVSGNDSGDSGGGITTLFDSAPKLTNVLISGNRAASAGGGIDLQSGSSQTRILVNVTITGNDAGTRGGGIFKANGVELRNTIIWNNRDQSGIGTPDSSMSDFFSSTAPVSNDSLVQGFSASDLPGSGALDGTTAANAPQFIQSVSPTAAPGSGGDLRLDSGSPLIDAGSNAWVAGIATDLDGFSRIVGPRVDLGPYESGNNLLFRDRFEQQ